MAWKRCQPALFDQVIAEPAEAKSGLVVAEAGARDHAKERIGGARCVAVAALEAEIDCTADDQGKQVPIRIECGRNKPGQHIERRKRRRVAHQRQLDELLNRCGFRACNPIRSYSRTRFLFRRMRRPLDAQMPEVFETDGNRAAALIECHVQIHAQARDRRAFDSRGRAGRQRRQALLCLRQCAGEELAFGTIQLERESQLVPALPQSSATGPHRQMR